jgi:hypothetical protein
MTFFPNWLKEGYRYSSVVMKTTGASRWLKETSAFRFSYQDQLLRFSLEVQLSGLAFRFSFKILLSG